MWKEIIVGGFTSYILTALLVDGTIFNTPRRWLRKKTQFLTFNSHWLFDCRLCLGFWVSIIVAFFIGNISIFLAIYGFSHFLSMIERR